LIENGDALTRAFFGVGESAEQSQDQMCSEIMDVLEQYNTPKNREFPSGSTALNLDLASFLFDGSAPESSGGYYFYVTEASLDTINDKVLASTSPLSPADVLKISIDANGGNIPLGVLAAHNYLKQIKYQGILDFKYGQPFPTDQGLPASHLASWREDSNITPAGEYDKMGPLYHIFAAMTAGIWFPTRLGGDIAVNGEAMLRSFQLLNDHPDMQKAAADACGDNTAIWLRNNPPTNAQSQPSNNVTSTNASVSDCDATQWIQVKYDTPDIESSTDNKGNTHYTCNERIHFIFSYSDPNRGVSINVKEDRSINGSIFSGWPLTGMGWEPGGDTNVIQYRENNQYTGYIAHDFYLAYTAYFNDIKDSINSGVRCAWIGNNIEASGIKILPLDNACK
jgi:hypothetical protein